MALDNVSAFFKIDFSRCLHSLRVLLVHATVLRSETALVVSYSTVSKLAQWWPDSVRKMRAVLVAPGHSLVKASWLRFWLEESSSLLLLALKESNPQFDLFLCLCLTGSPFIKSETSARLNFPGWRSSDVDTCGLLDTSDSFLGWVLLSALSCTFCTTTDTSTAIAARAFAIATFDCEPFLISSQELSFPLFYVQQKGSTCASCASLWCT